ncbi:MAG: putative hemolysin [Saprospiraceae bacterium]|jgi:putative hemolysin
MTITLIIIFLLFSALFSGTEIAFISASKLAVELKRSKGSLQGRVMARFYDKPASFLSTMLVGNNIALVVFTILMTEPLEQFFMDGLGFHQESLLLLLINTLIITVIILLIGEFLPKTLFRLFANEILYFLAFPLELVRIMLFIPAWIMTKLSNLILRVFLRTRIDQVESVITRLDLENFIKDKQIIDSEEEIDTSLFGKALNLKTVKVKDCMVPRTEIENVDINASVDDLKQVIMESHLSRIIVTEDDIDNVMGYVHHQQLLALPKTIKEIVLKIPFVPEAMRVRDLMYKFIKDELSIACVVDEFGGIAGIITMEDILEEIFGEIEDEHDQEEYVETQVTETEYIFSGRLEIDYLNDKYENLDFPEGEYSTLSGYVVTTTETIPAQGATIEQDGFRFIFELVSDTKIETIRVIKLPKIDEKVV